MLDINKVRKIVKGEFGLALPTNPYIQSDGKAFPLMYGSASYSPEAQAIASQGMQKLSNQYNQTLKNKQDIVSSSRNPQETARKFAEGKSTTSEIKIPNQLLDFSNSLLQSKKESYNGRYGNITQFGDQLVQQGSNLLSTINPVLGYGLKGINLVGNVLGNIGGSTDGMTKTDALLNTGLGNVLTLGLNGFLGKKTQDFSVNKQTIEQVGGSYGGTVSQINNAESKANKKYGLFSGKARRNANDMISDAKNKQNIMTDIAQNAYNKQSIATNMSDLNHIQYSLNLDGGYDQRYVRAAKQGEKIKRIKKLQLHKIGGTIKQSINVNTKQIEEWSPIITECFEEGGTIEWQPTIEIMKEGGKTEELDAPKIEETTQKNIIPEGALHARKHHMENAEGLTKKGIPVIDNEGEQQAEIEKNEIIFTLEVTKKLEELMKDGSDEAAIEAGKLLVKEILFNTEDRTGLIGTLGKGGVIDVVS